MQSSSKHQVFQEASSLLSFHAHCQHKPASKKRGSELDPPPPLDGRMVKRNWESSQWPLETNDGGKREERRGGDSFLLLFSHTISNCGATPWCGCCCTGGSRAILGISGGFLSTKLWILWKRVPCVLFKGRSHTGDFPLSYVLFKGICHTRALVIHHLILFWKQLCVLLDSLRHRHYTMNWLFLYFHTRGSLELPF